MTLEWADICGRCGEPHEAELTGHRVVGSCDDRLSLLGILRQRPSFCELHVYSSNGEKFIQHFPTEASDLVIRATSTISVSWVEVRVGHPGGSVQVSQARWDLTMVSGETLTIVLDDDTRTMISTLHTRAKEIGFGPALLERMGVT